MERSCQPQETEDGDSVLQVKAEETGVSGDRLKPFLLPPVPFTKKIHQQQTLTLTQYLG